MSLAVTVTNHWDDTKKLHVIGSIVASGNYTTGGDTIDFGLYPIKSHLTPVDVQVQGIDGYLYRFLPGTTINNGKLKVILVSTGAELAQAGYPGGVTGDTLTFNAIFRKL